MSKTKNLAIFQLSKQVQENKVYRIKSKMSVFHRKHSGSSKNFPVLLSSERAENSNIESLPGAVQDEVEQIGEDANVTRKLKKTIPSKTFDHVKSYPLVQQTRSFLYQIPVARVVIANTKPVVRQVLESKPLQLVLPVTNLVDNVANSSLNLTEKVVPSLKTKTYQRLGEEALIPYNLTMKYGKQITDTTVTIIDQNVYQPAHGQVLKFRKYYNEKFYDTNGKPLVRSTLDPVTAPFNNLFEKLTIQYFPEGKKVPKEGYSSELNRSVALFINFVSRSAPVLESNVFNISMLPCNYVLHVNNVFNENLDKQPKLTMKYSWAASKDSVKKLKGEAIEYAKENSPHKLLKCKNSKKKRHGYHTQGQQALQDRIEEVEAQIQAQAA